MKKTSFVLTINILWILVSIISPQPNAMGQTNSSVYDLSLCIKNALQNHPTLLQSQNMIKYDEHGIDLAKGELGPHLSINSSLVQFKSNQDYVTLLTTSSGDLITKERSGTDYLSGLTLSQPIYKSGSFLGFLGFYAPSVEREKNNLTSQKFTDLQLRGDVIFDIIDAYGKILKTLNSLKIEEESSKTSELLYKTSLAKYNLDLINKSGLLDAERILANHQAKIVELRSTLEINLATLLNKVGGGEKISKISEDLSQFRKVVCDEESLPSLEKLFEMAYQKRNDIKAQEAKIQSHQNNLKVVNSKRYPEVNLGANYYYRGDFSNSDNKSWAWNVLFRLDWYLFDFGETSAKVAQQKDLILAQQEVLRALKNVIVLQVQTSYQTIISFGARLTGLKKSIEQAKETLAMTEEKYKKAFLTEVDVLKARDQLNQVEQTYYETEIDLIVNRVVLKKSIGLDIPVSYGL